MEFTRLAQITKQAKYYDAIARITNELEIWQENTSLPGMWPITVDASGCKKPQVKTTPVEQVVLNGGKHSLDELASGQLASTVGDEDIRSGHLLHPADAVDLSHNVPTPASQDLAKSAIQTVTDLPEVGEAGQVLLEEVPTVDDIVPVKEQLGRRQLPDEDFAATQTAYKPDEPKPSPTKQPDCEVQGLSAPPKSDEEFSLGGRSDSTYEYLPKEYMLLGGLEDKYRMMYERSIEAVKTHLLYRPMIPGERKILFSGSARVKTTGKLNGIGAVTLTAEATHLACFAGGMFAVGAKIFGHEADMDIAAKLTDGCVWAYEATTTGIMPEDATMVSCEDREDCSWNETRWHEALDPYRERREFNRLAQEGLRKARESLQDQALLDHANKAKAPPQEAQTQQAALPATPAAQLTQLPISVEAVTSPAGALRRRQIGPEENDLTYRASTEAAEDFAGIPIPKVPQQDTENGAAPRKIAEGFSGSSTQKVPQQITENDAAPTKEGEISAGTPTQKLPQQGVEMNADFDKNTETVEGFKKVAGEAAGAAAQLAASGAKPTPITRPTPSPILTHEQYVEGKIKDERLPPGFINMKSKKYILRYVKLE